MGGGAVMRRRGLRRGVLVGLGRLFGSESSGEYFFVFLYCAEELVGMRLQDGVCEGQWEG